MDKISATDAKNSFAAVIARAVKGERIEIARHGRVVAVVAPAGSFAAPADLRATALRHQQLTELQRLSRHQTYAIQLLTATHAQVTIWRKQARAAVDRWEQRGSCSREFIEGWRGLLKLPVAEMSRKMCGNLDGWGPAMRQNSPWTLVL